MSIVVTTPTGNIGSRVAQLLIHAGVRPILLARDSSRLAPEVRAAADVRQGDLADVDFVLEATRGASALFWLAPHDLGAPDPAAAMLELGRNGAEAVRRNEIERTVFLSSGGAESRGDDLIGTLGRIEELFDGTGRNVVHLRPGHFYTNLLMSVEEIRQGVLTTTLPVDIPTGWNDPRDIGDVAAARLLSREWSGQVAQPIHGPEELSYAQVAEIIAGAVGRPVQAVQITDEESREGMIGAGLPPAGADALVLMARRLREGFAAEWAKDLSTRLPTRLAGWCYDNLRPALDAAA